MKNMILAVASPAVSRGIGRDRFSAINTDALCRWMGLWRYVEKGVIRFLKNLDGFARDA